jgi:hypothetical protein
MSVTKRILLMLVAVVLLGGVFYAQGQCWYCAAWPGNCEPMGCHKAGPDLPYVCSFGKGKGCPPLEQCLSTKC